MGNAKQEEGENSLKARIKNIGYNLLTIKNIECNYLICKKAEAVCKRQELRKNIILISKEAINNIAKYSNATEATISLSANNNPICLSIRDNGTGFNTNNLQPGNGLKNIQERAMELNGNAHIQSEVGRGTSIICTLPIT